jgi:predicted DNA binding protein
LIEPRARDRLRLAIDVADPAFADRIASVLADVEGIALVGKEDEPDAVIVAVAAATELDAGVALTARELEVLALLAEGASNKQIARRLGISTHTAKYHVASLLEKLDAHAPC